MIESSMARDRDGPQDQMHDTAEMSARRIAMIGPLPPFRSGIAQHTMMLGRELAERSDLLLVSFTRQYPKWLFPGESDRDPDSGPLTEPYCTYLLDSLNPLTWEQTVRRVLEHQPQAVVIPWWTVYWTACYVFLTRRLKTAGIPVWFLTHNVVDHEAAMWKRAMTRVVLRAGAGFITQSEGEKRRLLTLVPGARVAVHPHPIYTQYPRPSAPLPRRAALELLFFGFVRPYKGLDVLLRALARLEGKDVMLTVAGEFWESPEQTRTLIAELGITDSVELIARYVSENEAANLFARCDALVLPYRSATGSGVLGLAYNYGKPVIASNVEGLADVVLDGETGFLVKPESVSDLAAVIRELTPNRAAGMETSIRRHAETLTWDSLADSLLSEITCTEISRRRDNIQDRPA